VIDADFEMRLLIPNVIVFALIDTEADIASYPGNNGGRAAKVVGCEDR
jgi:hypothetical protein